MTIDKKAEKISSPVNEMVSVEISSIKPSEAYKLLTGAIIPRPIALVSTVSKEGVGNLAPFSFFNGICSNPACLMISIARKPDGSKKDTLINIEQTGQFVVNSSSSWIGRPMVESSAAYPYGVDELLEVGLTPLSSRLVKPVRVKESAIHFECEVLKSIEIGDGAPGSATVVFGKILMMHIHKAAYKDGKIIATELSSLARLSGFNYALMGDAFEMKPEALK